MRTVTIVFFVAALAGCSGASGTPPIPGSSSGSAPAATRALDRYESVYSFSGGTTGGIPQAGLLLHNGLLYGTTSSYGKGSGTVFSIDAFGKVRVVYAFNDYPDGQYPEAGLIWFDGALYGTTSAGGSHGGGTVFSVTTGGIERVVHSFGKRGDGSLPAAGLIALDGVLYGTTKNGGLRDKGTVFELDASGERILHSFSGAPNDGGHPTAGLVRYKNALYGTTRAGGRTAAGGTVYKVTPFGEEGVVHSFGVKSGDGENPSGPLVVVNGEFYGTTLHGGRPGGFGTVFAMSPTGSEDVLHAFVAGSDGAFPVAGLLAVGGELYGTTMNGGLVEKRSGACLTGPSSLGGATCGTVFKINAFGQENVIYRFRGYPDGANPEAGLTDVDGALYGTTAWGGSHVYFGTVFRSLR